ncbi:MAG: HlyD family secretion protein [Marinobacter sp.]|nr:HlyD family secretion protein [Marinobacter sp.]
MSQSDDSPQTPVDVPRKRWLRRSLLIAIPAVAVIGMVLYMIFGGRYISTENAYVRAPLINLSPDVSGRISAVLVRENQAVHKGDALIRIDAAPYRIAVKRAEAQVHQAENRIKTLEASYATRQQDLALARENVRYARNEYARQQALAKRNLTSQSELEKFSHQLATAQRKQSSIEHDLARIAASLDGRPGLPLDQHPDVQAAQASLASARLDLARTDIRAPFDGIASKLPDPGSYARSGAPVMSLVGTRDIWIEANFKETALTRMHPGQPVTISIDTYPDHDLHGTVASLAQASGSEFSVLPAQNASGNWVKVVQRIPVRIAVDSAPSAMTLRAGMSASVEVDTGYPGGQPPALVGWIRNLVEPAHADERQP